MEDPSVSLTPATIVAALRVPPEAVANNWPLIEEVLDEQGIRSDLVEIAAAATVGVEVPRFEPICELGGRARFARYDHHPGLGNTEPGDGYRFRGRGFIQLTGRANYEMASKALKLDLVGNPNAVLEPRIAAWILAWFFRTRHVADAANQQDWERVRRRVNGGLNGWDRFHALVEALHG